MNSLVDLIAREGVKVANLERIYATSRDGRRLVLDAMAAMRHLDSDIAWRAVWLLKRSAGDRRLSADDLIALAAYAEELPHWASRLILCQLFAATGCPAEARETLFPYLVECFANRRPMIRAWAVSVMVGFEGDERFQKTIQACLQEARADPAGSIQSRLRQLQRRKPSRAKPTTSVVRSGFGKVPVSGHQRRGA